MNSIHESVKFGVGCVIGNNVHIDEGTIIGNYCIIDNTHIGKNNKIGNFCIIGSDPLIEKLPVSVSGVQILDNNIIYDNVNISKGLYKNTFVRCNNVIHSNCYIGHDIIIDNHNILKYSCSLAGEVYIANYTKLNANVSISNKISVYDSAFIGAESKINQNVLPYSYIYGGYRPRLIKSTIKELKEYFYIISKYNNKEIVLQELSKLQENFIRDEFIYLIKQHGLNFIRKKK